MRAVSCFCFLAVAGLLPSRGAAQTAPGGLAPEWDVRKTLENVAAEVSKLDPILNQMRPKDWISEGAPQAYAQQLESVRVQSKAVATAAQNLQHKPDQIVPLLQLVFRIQSFDVTLRSLEEGLRKYQNPSLADLMVSVTAEGAAARDRLQQYAVELATEHEQQFSVADREAQRCRESISKSPRSTR